ncbi:MAG: flagellar hook-basal body protein [Thermoguttaceae bacterium]|jgi:flagellar basal-body rod protein FlgF/flagellar basal-body rod protein FlgG
MPYGLYISADGAQAQDKNLEVIANNLANVDTVGFKRELAVFQSRYAEAAQQGLPAADSGAADDVGGGVVMRETKTDFSTAPLKRTDVPTDLAVNGDGFFAVRKGQEILLTRAGNFRWTARGELVTQQGYSVLSDSNSPVALDPNGGTWQITASGAVRQDGSSQNLAIVQPASLGDLVKVGENLFRPLAATQPVPEPQRNVATGYLESSGVQPATEMLAMIQASRIFEANLSMMKTQNQMLSELISQVLKV